MGMVNITINGQKFSVPGPSTVLEAAQQAGVDIPTLCHHPALVPIGACRICLVEVKGQRVLQPACTFPISEGMEIQTESPAVVKVRKFVLDMLFSERNHYCMYCEISGDCELQNLGYRYGLDHWVYPTYTKRFPVDATRETFLMDHNRCVLCRRCVRACGELVANHTLGMRQRGASSMIHADLDVPFGESSCISCGTCLQVCPTGALIDKRSAFMGRNIQTEHVSSTCSQCSVGCGIKIVVRGGSVLRVDGDWDAAVNGGLLCQKGRFAPLYEKRQRVTTPLIRQNGQLKAASWDEALQMVARRLASAASAGAGKVGVLASTQATNEALYLVSQLFHQELEAGNVGLLNGTVPRLQKPQGSLADVAQSDLILVVGADPVTDQPVASFVIKRTVDMGARLLVVDGEDNPLAPLAHTVLSMDELDEALDLAARAEHPVVVYGAGLTAPAARALEALEQATFIALEPGVNTRAAVAFGLNLKYNPSNAEVVYILAGEEAWDGKEVGHAFVAVQASYRSPLTERADVVLPMAIWSERSGSLTNFEGRVQKASPAIEPEGEAKPDWEILSLLASKMGKKLAASFNELSDHATQTLK
jgi:formate dehydrogenase major subunit